MVRMNNGQPIDVLLVEDDPGDVELTLEVLKESKLMINIDVVGDGVQALKYLNKESDYKDKTRPDLILLDLNMPRMDGRELLEEIKKDRNLKSIPVVILTTSDANEDITRSYTSGASSYVTKPVGLDEFTKVVRSIETFWFTIVKFPPRD